MGVPAHGRKHLHHRDLLSEMPTAIFKESVLKSMSGNGMHLAVVGCLLMCTVKHVQIQACLVLDD